MAKGSQFERDICKSLSLWWTNGEREDVFWRTAGSGARATSRAKVGKATANSYGDIAALDSIGEPFINKFVIELKRGYKDLNIQDLMDKPKKGKPSLFDQFWTKVCMEAIANHRNPMLIFKKDRREILICITGDIFRFLQRESSVSRIPTCIRFEIRNNETPVEKIIIMKFHDFIEWANPIVFKGEIHEPERSFLQSGDDSLGTQHEQKTGTYSDDVQGRIVLQRRRTRTK